MPRPPQEIWDHPEVASVFRCQGCGACCRGAEAGIELSPEEASEVAHHLGLSEREFRAGFCLRRGGRLSLRRQPNGMCSLWREGSPGRRSPRGEAEGSLAGCLAWEVKPRTCSLWPFPASLLTDEAGLAAVRASCPGIAPEATPEALLRALRLVHRSFPPPKTERRPRTGQPPSRTVLAST